MSLKPNIEAQRAVVGAVLIEPATLGLSRAKVDASSFTDEPCRLTFAAMESLSDQGKAIDSLIVKDELEKRGDLDRVGGVAFFAELSGEVPTSANAEHYAQIVADEAAKAELAVALEARAKDARNGKSAATVISDLLGNLDKLGVRESDAPARTEVAELLENPPPEMEYLFESVLPRGVPAGCDAQGGAAKSMLAQILVTSACTGRELLKSFRPAGAMRVLWIESEDPPDEIARRFDRILRAFDLTENTHERLADNLTLYAGQAFPLNRVENGVVIPTKGYRWLEREVKRTQPDLIVLDPRSHFFAGDENSNADVAAFMNLLKTLTTIPENGCSIWVNHHVSKAKESEASSASGRGASAARDAMRALWSLTPLTKAERDLAGIELASGFVKLECTKSNWNPLGNGPIYLKRLQGECGGVLVETDMRKMRAEAENARLGALSKAFAESIGDNSSDLSVRQICREQGQGIRDDLKAEFGSFMTIPKLRQAIEHGRAAGHLVLEGDQSKSLGAKIPRQKMKGPAHG